MKKHWRYYITSVVRIDIHFWWIKKSSCLLMICLTNLPSCSHDWLWWIKSNADVSLPLSREERRWRQNVIPRGYNELGNFVVAFNLSISFFNLTQWRGWAGECSCFIRFLRSASLVILALSLSSPKRRKEISQTDWEGGRPDREGERIEAIQIHCYYKDNKGR